MDLTRMSTYGIARVGTTLLDSEPFAMQGVSGGHVHVPAGETPINLSFYVADRDSDDAVYSVAKNSAGVAITSPALAGDAIEMHSSLFSSCRIKILADAITGTGTVAYRITMKS